MSSPAKALGLRAPSVSKALHNPDFKIPSSDFILGKWHVIQSSLPMWKSKRNVCITYTPLPDDPEKLDDLVEYQTLSGESLKTVRGIDIPDSGLSAAYSWRGKGWLKIATSHWEIIGYGELEGGWAVTYFGKTLFTPAGIDVYSRRKQGLSEGLLQRIHGEMRQLPDEALTKMLDGVFAVDHG